MARTYRATEGVYHSYFRHPRVHNELSKLDTIIHDVELAEYPMSKLNHMKSREHSLPSSFDTEIDGSYYELYYTNK